MAFALAPSTRLRPSPFYEATVAAGVVSFTTYNRMLLPTGYGDPQAENDRLLNGVSLWDVGAERQIEMLGPDAAKLAQAISPRDLSKHAVGQGKYVALCDHDGVLINDPIISRLAEDRYWVSIADSDVAFHIKAVARERNFDVEIFEADAAPLAIQGPLARDVAVRLFGDWVLELRHFWFRPAKVGDIDVIVARSGWSKQTGYEVYMLDPSRGTELWDAVMAAGETSGIGPGNPNGIERIESGLLSWGGDTDDETNPFEVGLGKYIDLNVADDVVGIQALRKIAADGARRQLLGLVLNTADDLPPLQSWTPITKNGQPIGQMVNRALSTRLGCNIGYALVDRSVEAGDRVTLEAMGDPTDDLDHDWADADSGSDLDETFTVSTKGKLVPLPFF